MIYSTATVPVNPQGESALTRTRQLVREGKIRP
jgi:hypothetical protein